MKDNYKTSRQIIGILAVIISLIMSINEDISFKIVATIFIYFVALAATFLTTPISKKIIKAGDAIANKYLRIFYYIIILPLTLLVAYILYWLVFLVYGNAADTMNEAAITILLFTATTIFAIVPYIQTLIVLACRRKQTDNKQ